MAISNKIHIVVIDDQPSTLQSVKDILKDSGFKNVYPKENAKVALEFMSEHISSGEKVDLILSDYDMPNMDGTQLYTEMQNNEQLKGTPFILMSGCADQTFIVTAVKLGIKSILLKPFSKQDLINELAKILS